jgi:formylglycine-generating enzyme required for sulfatase activity
MALVCAAFTLYAAPVWAGPGRQQAAPAAPPPQAAEPRYTGDGGKGTSLAILAPQAAGLAKGQDYLPALVQGELVSVFSGYSAIAVLDRAHLDEQYKELESRFYDDNAAAGGDLGRLSPTDYILGGTITRTATGYALQMRVSRTADKITAASYSGTCTFTELDNLSVIRRASLDLLEKLGVAVTARTRQELSGAAAVNHVQAQTAQAQGLTALAQGATVEAMTYYYQAVSFEPALQDSRLSQLTAQVSGGLGAGVKNDIQARRDWLNLMKECAAFMRDHPPYELLYDPGVEQDGAIDYAKETANFTMRIALAPSVSGFQVLNNLLAGLDKTGRRTVWGFDGWPFLPLTPAAPEALLWGGKKSFGVTGTAALVNADGKTLGRAQFSLTTDDISFSAGARNLAAPPPPVQVVRFANVNANDLTDPLTVRILNVNGKTAEAAGEAGYIRIAAGNIGEQERQRERDRLRAANMVRVNGGAFMMGSPASEAERFADEVQHRVTVSSFYLGRYEVTQKEWREVMGNNPSYFKGDDLPVENVSWYDAVEYCNKRSQKEGLTPAYTIKGTNVTWNKKANGYRLPTEAEWEYACRAGTTTPFSTGNNITTSQANYDGDYPYSGYARGSYREKTTPAGTFAPNAWGLYDMHGNVWEWCWDWFGDYASGAQTDPSGAGTGSRRVLRGGAWLSFARELRSAYRAKPVPEDRGHSLGFRLARNAE